MAHPFKSQSDAFKGKAAQRVGKQSGGSVKPLQVFGGGPQGPKGSLERLGGNVYSREVNKGMAGGDRPNLYGQKDVFKADGGAVTEKNEKPAERGETYAKGGKVKSGKVNINIIVPGAGAKAGPPTMPPPMLGPAGLGPGGPPGSPMPPMKSGGRVKKAHGGKLTGSADTGVGRIQVAARQKAARGGK